MEIFRDYLTTPLGLLQLNACDEGMVSVLFDNQFKRAEQEILSPHHPVIAMARLQLQQYFERQRTVFDLPLKSSGTVFYLSVWDELRKIEYGKTLTYKALASKLGNKDAVRAVALAVGRNRLNIIIPCHRVVGSDGSLRGYAGGLHRKAWLLEFEKQGNHQLSFHLPL